MILFINTSKTDLIQVKLIKNNKVIGQWESHEEYKHSELLLKMIDKLLRDTRPVPSEAEGYAICDMRCLAVVSGPGAFSALRLGVVTVNALAWSFKIPIIELCVNEATSDEVLLKALKNKKLIPNSQFLIPKYGKEPNITKARS